ncbi:MAG: preprotein translocase subunit SecY [Bacilli bacterium]|nr:preprotein translocase subunit SecY [Bacilli bacterium]
MLNMIKQIFSPKNKDIRNKLLFTLGILAIFIIGSTIQVPKTSSITENLGFLELLNSMGGGALKRFSIFALGVMPYISATIITQILQMDIIPYFSELAKEGNAGRRKINKINRYIGIVFAFVQGYVFATAFLPAGSGVFEFLRVSLILTAGTAFLLWLGDQITQKGIGNGISIIIMAGILTTTPTMFVTAFNEMVKLSSTQSAFIGIVTFILFVLVYLGIIIGIIFIQQAERRIPIQYSNRTTSSYGSKQTYMPIKLNSAGVIPVILASSVIAIPASIAQFLKNEKFTLFVEKYLNYTSVTGCTLYMVFIILFAYVYTFFQINPNELSGNLQKQGGYIPGIRPGNETSTYIKQVLSRLTVVGALFLIVIAGLPIIFSNLSNLSSSITIGGTGLLIVVGVLLDTYNQLGSQLLTRNYNRR